MALVRVSGGGRLERVTVQNDSDDYGVEVLGAGKLRDVTIFGTHPTAQIAFIGNDAVAKEIDCAGDGDGVVISGNNCIVDVKTGAQADLACSISGADNRVDLFANTPVEDGLLLSGLRNKVDVHIISPGEDGANITGDHNRVTGTIYQAERHGCIISGDANRIDLDVEGSGFDADDTYDNFAVEGTATRNKLTGMSTPRSTGNQTRHGVFLDTNTADNHVTDLDFGDVSAYGTSGYVDNGTNDNTYPGDATYGDNWSQ